MDLLSLRKDSLREKEYHSSEFVTSNVKRQKSISEANITTATS